MTPYTLDFTTSTTSSLRQTDFQSPQTLTPSKRIILGNIQSPTATEINSRISQLIKSPCNTNRGSKIHSLIEDRTCYKSKREKLLTRGENKENCYVSLIEKKHCESRQTCSYTEVMEENSISCHKVDSPVARTRSVMCSRKKSLTWTLARISSESPSSELQLLTTPKKQTLDQLDSTSRDSGYEHSETKPELYLDENTVPFAEPHTFTKMLTSKPLNSNTKFGLENDHLDSDIGKLNYDTDDFQTLHDLEEFETGNVEECSKYEIISTDSPNIISRSTASTRRVESKNFIFGAPILDSEQSTSFNPISRSNTATRMLNFDDTTTAFEFASPATIRPKRAPATTVSVKKALSFTKCDDTPTKLNTSHTLRHEHSDSSIGSMVSMSTNDSPCSQRRGDRKNASRVGLFHSESTESGFMSEIEDSFLLEMEQTIHDDEINANSPKVANFGALISGTIKETLLPTMEESKDFNALNRTPSLSRIRRPILSRSMSMNVQSDISGSPVDNVRLSLFKSSLDSPNGESRLRPFKRPEPPINTESSTCESVYSKRRKSSKCDEEVEVKPFRPVLQRAYSENAASVISALARSSNEPDLIGDFSKPFSLPMTHGKHQDLKSISSDTLADLMTGKYDGSIDSYQVIDCRYPYEYEGGHIRGAANMYTREQLTAALISRTAAPSSRRHVLVFHCEFSLERGPNLSRFLRSVDRAMNKDFYPSLDYPEIYLLHDGYKDFHAKYTHLCEPNLYVPMLAPGFDAHLRQFRAETNNSAVDVKAVTALRIPGHENAGPSRVNGLFRHKSKSRIFM